MYSVLKKMLFSMPPERAHDFMISMGQTLQKSSSLINALGKNFCEPEYKPRNIMGLDFRNPIGLAAGFDKNAKIVNVLEEIGFGFVEVGTVTLRAQVGNPKPRLFRDVKNHGILNRMGFNNEGADKVLNRLNLAKKRSKYHVPLGINLGKNKTTPDDKATEDYLLLAHKFKEAGDYFVVNVSSPNTPGLRNLQNSDFLMGLSQELKKIISAPLFVKLAADLTNSELDGLLIDLERSEFDGIILCNTTVDKDLAPWAKDLGVGGLSGRLLRMRSREMLMLARARFTGPIISVGGVDSASEVDWRLRKGADLVQVYSELIFSGPYFVDSLLRDLKEGKL